MCLFNLSFSSVYADGSICLDILQNQWSPIYDVAAILTSIQVLNHFQLIYRFQMAGLKDSLTISCMQIVTIILLLIYGCLLLSSHRLPIQLHFLTAAFKCLCGPKVYFLYTYFHTEFPLTDLSQCWPFFY